MQLTKCFSLRVSGMAAFGAAVSICCAIRKNQTVNVILQINKPHISLSDRIG